MKATPQSQRGTPRPKTQTRKRPYIPVVISTLDMRAETLLGAAGCASGSHPCNGTRPAFTPKPTKKRTNKTFRRPPPATEPLSAAENDGEPAREVRTRKPATRHPVPTCDIAR